MTSAGKWVLGLLLLVVGAVFVARTVSSDPGGSSATVKNNLPGAAVAGAAKDAKDAAAVEAAAKKKIASTIAGDVSCKKACIEVNEVAADSITTAKLAPGSVTLSKLAFEVPNLNELENEINARKAAEASVKAAQAEAAAASAKNDAAITAAASNGITQEAAARTAADEALAKNTAAADADLLSKLNTEVKDRSDADNVLQGKLNTEISDRQGGINNLRSELANPNQVASPIVQINNNEIVDNAVTTNKILADTILAEDLATGSVTTAEILDDTVAAIDLANGAVVGRAAGETLTNVKARSLRGEREDNDTVDTSAGDIAVGTITGEGAPTADAATGNIALGTITGQGDNVEDGAITGNLGLETVGRENLVDDVIDGSKIQDDTVGLNDIAADAIRGRGLFDAIDTVLTNIHQRSIRGERQLNGTESAGDIALGSITGENNNTEDGIESGNLGLETVGRENLVDNVINGSKIEDRSVDSLDIAQHAVTAFELSDNSVDTAAIVDGAVTNAKLDATSGSEAVDTNVIRDDAVTGAKIASLTITADHLIGSDIDNATTGATRAVSAKALADGAVTNRAITDGALAIAKLDTDIATQAELDAAATDLDDFRKELSNTGTFNEGGTAAADEAGDPVSFFKIKDLTTAGDGNITGEFIEDGSLSDDDIADVAGSKVTGAVASATNAANAANAADVTCGVACIDSAEIVSVDFGKLTGVTITSGMLGDDSVIGGSNGSIKDGSITAADLAGSDAGTIVAGAVTSEKIADGTIAGRDLAPDSVDSTKIGNGQIGTTELADGAVTTNKVTSNTAGGTDVAAPSALAAPPTSADVPALVGTLVVNDTAGHNVLVTGQAMISCTCLATQDAVVEYQVVRSEAATPAAFTAVSPVYETRVAEPAPLKAPIAVSIVDRGVPTGTYTYKLRVLQSSGAGVAVPSQSVLNAVDLGR